ncbi:MAG: 2-C-methyl-D-erythritol 2,4-cyclodiphosphate synthase [Clostridiales bacterium]|nr:2-C-methyl-D-erythritol 2,4-cyclodiphosphate synthase [Clostridiales bacterium]
MEYAYISTIGQDSHRFKEEIKDPSSNFIMLGGYPVPHDRAFEANSDGDVILHAITNAISGYTGVNILGGAADELCLQKGIKDSRVYLKEALKYMKDASVVHVSITVECLRPKLKAHIPSIKKSVASLLEISEEHVGLTATTGEGLTDFGRGEGVQVFTILTIKVPS